MSYMCGKKSRVQYENIRIVGCKDCEFWGFCSFASFSSPPSRTRKIHGLNGLVYYFLYLDRPLSARVRPKSQPLSTLSRHFFSSRSFVAATNSLFSFFLAPLPPPSLSLLPADVYRPKSVYLAALSRNEVSHMSRVCSPLGVFIFFFRTINRKTAVREIASGEMYDCLRAPITRK